MEIRRRVQSGVVILRVPAHNLTMRTQNNIQPLLQETASLVGGFVSAWNGYYFSNPTEPIDNELESWLYIILANSLLSLSNVISVYEESETTGRLLDEIEVPNSIPEDLLYLTDEVNIKIQRYSAFLYRFYESNNGQLPDGLLEDIKLNTRYLMDTIGGLIDYMETTAYELFEEGDDNQFDDFEDFDPTDLNPDYQGIRNERLSRLPDPPPGHVWLLDVNMQPFLIDVEYGSFAIHAAAA